MWRFRDNLPLQIPYVCASEFVGAMFAFGDDDSCSGSRNTPSDLSKDCRRQCILGTQTFALHDFTCKAFSLGCHQAIRGSIAFKFQVHGDWPASPARMFVVPCLWLAPGQQICVRIQDAACARAELDTRSFGGTSRATDMFIPCNYPGTKSRCW